MSAVYNPRPDPFPARLPRVAPGHQGARLPAPLPRVRRQRADPAVKIAKIFSRLLAAGLAASCFAVAQAQDRALPDLRGGADASLQRGLERVVRDLGLDAAVRSHRLALALVDVSTPGAPRLAMLNGDEIMYAASLPKIAILFGALVEADGGRLKLDEKTVGAMTNMIRYSSNDDATRVLGWVGGERLLEILQSDRYRFYDVAGGGGLWVGKAYGKEAAFRRDPVGNLSHGATAFQVARLYYLLANNALLSPRLNELMKETLSSPGIRHKFVKGLESLPGVRLYRKSGTWKDFHADSALVEQGGRRYVMVAIAEHPEAGRWLERLALPLHGLVTSPAPTAPTTLAGR
jgi:beta-lactamase class A